MPRTSKKSAETTTSTTTSKKTAYKANQDGIIASDDGYLVELLNELEHVKDIKDATTEQQEGFLAKTIKTQAANKNFLLRLWYSLIDTGISKPKTFSSLKIDGLLEALFNIRESVYTVVKGIYQKNKAKQYINTHSTSQSNILTKKPTINSTVNVCKKVNDVHVKLGKGIVIGDTQDDESKVEVSITQVDSDSKLVHDEVEFISGAILSWPWADLATSIEMMQRKSAEDGVLGTSLRPRVVSSTSGSLFGRSSIGGGNNNGGGSSSIGSSSGSSSGGSSSGDSSSIGNNGGDGSNSELVVKLQNELKKMREDNTELKRKREEDQLAFQALKKKYDRVNENMQETRKEIANLHKNMDGRCQLEEGQYVITLEGVKKVLEESDLADLVKRKQPNVVLEHLMKLFLLETVSAQQYRGLDLIMQRMCPLMLVSKSRFKNFKQRKGALFNRQIDDGTTARSSVLLVDEHGIEDVLLKEGEQNTDLDTTMDTIQEETTQSESN